MNRRFLLFALIMLASFNDGFSQDSLDSKAPLELSSLRELPVLDGDRFKPLDSLARESVQAVTGRERFGSHDPVVVFLDWAFESEFACDFPFVKLPDARTAKELGFNVNEGHGTHRSWTELSHHQQFRGIVREALKTASEDRSVVEREALRLHGRWSLFAAIAGISHKNETSSLGYLPFIASAEEMREGVPYRWLSPAEASFDERATRALAALDKLRLGFRNEDALAFKTAADELVTAAAAIGYPASFPGAAKMKQEVFYHRVQPFFHASLLYALTAFLALLAFFLPRARLFAFLPLILGLGLHTWGLFERSSLSDRALIGNLYESLVFVAACAALIGLVFELQKKCRWFLLGGSLLAACSLAAALSFPEAMNPKITALRPVLVNNFWIHVHVPTIMASYAALGLAWVMAHAFLIRYLFHPENDSKSRELARLTYSVMPLGLILLLAGMVLGGVWADASWGRFWGWDPKETWSFITWIVFLVIVHGRWSGWLGDFGTSMGTMIGGWALMWTYYGVNFFQSGLHSYAGAGGPASPPPWLWIFSAIEISLCAFAVMRWRQQSSAISSLTQEAPDVAGGDAAAEGAQP